MNRPVTLALPKYIVQNIIKPMRQIIDDYGLVEQGDRLVVGYSGGKDSLMLILSLAYLKHIKAYNFHFEVIHINPGYPTDFSQVLPYFDAWKIPFCIEHTNINEQIDLNQASSICYRCGRLRKGALKRLAQERKFNKIAFGHHRDDLVETFFMNLFNNGSIGGLAPLRTEEQSGMAIIRPMLAVDELAIEKAIQIMNLPVISSCCPYNGKTQREHFKNWIKSQQQEMPHIKDRVFAALGNVDDGKLL